MQVLLCSDSEKILKNGFDSPYNPWGCPFQDFYLRSTTHKNTDYIYRVCTGKVKVKLSLYRPWRTLGLREVEATTFSDIRLIDGDKVVSPTRRPLFTPRKIPGTHFC
jgi:hypothetical protein